MVMKDKEKPKVLLDASEIYQDVYEQENQEDITSVFQCIFCHGIPIDPHECAECEVVFCLECK